MTSSVTDVFLTVANWYKARSKCLSKLVSGGRHGLNSGCASADDTQSVLVYCRKDTLLQNFENH